MTSTHHGTSQIIGRPGLSKKVKRRIWSGVILALILGVVFGTKVVSNDDPLAGGDAKFNAEAYAEEHFPEVREIIMDQAVDATELAKAMADDPAKAADEFAQSGGGTPVYSVKLTGVVGDGASGIFDIDVAGVPDDLRIRLQTGPAINGTDLRDATGTMPFGDFSNQIDFQNVGSALNAQMSADILSDLDRDSLTGKSVTVVGAFSAINAAAWLITPVALDVK